MVNIITLNGGLGNQMFAYAFSRIIKRKQLCINFLDPINCYNQHNGFELYDVFRNIGKKKSIDYYRRIHKLHTKYITKKIFISVNESKSGIFSYSYFTNYYPFKVFHGFWQSEKYFFSISKCLRFKFQFDFSKTNILTKELLLILPFKNSVSIHVRRNDYIGNSELDNICIQEYYRKAISLINKKVIHPEFYIFTDDKKWVSENFSFINYQLVYWNNYENSWQDMYLMSKCKYNIIANSTFSWWGAWLNENPDKIVIAPSKWFNSFSYDDIIPEAWIKI